MLRLASDRFFVTKASAKPFCFILAFILTTFLSYFGNQDCPRNTLKTIPK